MCPHSRHLPYKICKINFRLLKFLSYIAPMGFSSRRSLRTLILFFKGHLRFPFAKHNPSVTRDFVPYELKKKLFTIVHNFSSVLSLFIYSRVVNKLGHIPSQKYDKTRFVKSLVLSHFFPLDDASLRLHQIKNRFHRDW